MNASEDLNEIKSVFSGTVPLIFSVMAEKQVLPTYWPLVRDSLLQDTGIQDRRVIQGIMVALSSRCQNNYCFITHSYFLLGLGLEVETIQSLVNELAFPSYVDAWEKWSLVLKWAFLFSHPQTGLVDIAGESYRVIRQLLSNDEYRHLFKICSVIEILNLFSEFYSNHIRVEDEEMFLDESATLKLPIPSLTKYYEQLSHSQSNADIPVVAICMYCKNIRDAEQNWHALENVLQSLDRNSSFTHGVCPKCLNNL